MAQEPILSARGLVKRYGRVTALDNADFDLYPGEILAVIGDNGAGKSSMIKAISGAITPDEGEIRLEGRPVTFRSPIEARKAGIETVYQNLALSPALSIADNMFLGREIRKPGIMGSVLRKLDRGAMEKFARDKLSELGLMTIQNINQAVETLSGGQRQGVVVARAAAFGSKVIILDEPTAALGVKESRRVLELILDVRHRAHLAQHAACLRGGGPHPYPPAGPAVDGHQSEGLHHVRRRRLHDRGKGALGGRRRMISPATIVDALQRRAGNARRFLVGLAGPPAAGKSTLAEALRENLLARGESAEILPMDGFHMDNAILAERGLLQRKGVPESFDGRGFVDIVNALKRAEGEVLVPVFDRSRELAVNAARAIPLETRFVLAEGNYLLFRDAPWDRLDGVFDFTIFVGPPYKVLEERLRQRWLGYALPADEIQWKLYGNDLPNGKRILENSRPADLHLDLF